MISELMITTFETSQGTAVDVRPLMVDDTPYLVDIFNHMGVQSRYYRFNEALHEVDPERIWQEAEDFALATAVNSKGLIVFADLPDQPQAPIGAARFIFTADDEAEMAVSIRDDMQGQGIGTFLINNLIIMARNAGVKKLTGTAHSDNKAVWGMLRKLDHPAGRTVDGNMVEMVFDLGRD